MDAEQQHSRTLREALTPAALRAAIVPQRPVFANPWDSEADMFAAIVAIAFVDPFLLDLGGKLMGSIFGLNSHCHLGVFMVAALVGAAGFMTIVGRERTNLAVDILTITGWVFLGLVVAPILGLALSIVPALICYGVLLLGVFAYVLRFGRWQTSFLRPISWPTTWSVLALFFAFSAYRLILYQ
jgi:hypothetical protein